MDGYMVVDIENRQYMQYQNVNKKTCHATGQEK
jgi:hypothetical protein